MKLLKLCAMTVSGLILATHIVGTKAYAKPPTIYIATEFVSTGSENNRQCVLEAEKTLSFLKFKVGLDHSIEPLERDGSLAAWGRMKSGTTATIRCVSWAEGGIVAIVAVAGNKYKDTRVLAEKLVKNIDW